MQRIICNFIGKMTRFICTQLHVFVHRKQVLLTSTIIGFVFLLHLFPNNALSAEYIVTNQNINLYSDQYQIGTSAKTSDSGNIYAYGYMSAGSLKIYAGSKSGAPFSYSTKIAVYKNSFSTSNLAVQSTDIINSSGGTVSFIPSEGNYYVLVATKNSAGTSVGFFINSPIVIQLAAPTVSSVSPTTATRGVSTTFTVYGTNLPSTIAMSLNDGNCGSPFSVSSTSASITCSPQLSGTKNFIVAVTSGGASISGSPKTVQVYEPAATVSSVSPTTATRGVSTTFTVYGTNFPSTIAMSLNDGNCGSPFSVSSTSASITCSPQLSGTKNFIVAVTSGGASISGSPKTVQVNEPANQPPIIIFTAAPSISGNTLTASVSTSASNNIVRTSFAIFDSNKVLIDTTSTVSIVSPSGAIYNATPKTWGYAPGTSSITTAWDINVSGLANGSYHIMFYNFDGTTTVDTGHIAITKTNTSVSVTGVNPTSAIVGKTQDYTITGSNLPASMLGNIEGTPGHCIYVSGSDTSIVLNCNAAVIGHRRFYMALTAGGAPIPGSESLHVDVAEARTAGDPAQAGSRAINRVDVATGNLFLTSTDLSVSGKGVPFSLSRSYNSLDAKWTFNYDLTLSIVSGTDSRLINIRREDGGIDAFYKDVDNLWYSANPGNFGMLEAQADGSYILYTKGSTLYCFGIPNGGGVAALTSIRDRDNNILTIAILSPTQKRITDAVGRLYTLDYDANGRLIKATDFASRSVAYTWDSNGNLSSFRDVLNSTTTYSYSTVSPYRLQTIRDPRGIAAAPQYDSMTVSYVTLASTLSAGAYHEGKVETVTDGVGNVTTYRYGSTSASCAADAQKVTGVIHPKTNYNTVNNNQAFCYDLMGRIALELNAENYGDYKTTRQFNAASTGKRSAEQGLINKITNPRNISTNFGYSDDGRGHRISSANALTQTTTYTHKTELNYPTAKPNLSVMASFKTPKNNSYSFEHLDTGNITSIKTPIAANPATQFSYIDGGLLQTVTDPNSNPTSYTYNANGTVQKVTDAKNQVTSYTYDTLGRVDTATDRRNIVTKYTYDAAGNVLTAISAYGTPRAATVTNTYDANGNLKTVTDARGNTRSYTYTKNNQLYQESFTVGGVTYTSSNIYDEMGRLWKTTNENSNTSQVTFDEAGRKKSDISPLPGVTTTYTYDDNGNVLTVTDALGHITTTTYDDLDRVKTVTDYLGNQVVNDYDEEGNLKSVRDPKLQFTYYGYDAAGKLISVTDANGGVTNAKYDAAGNLTEVTGPAAGNKVSYVYDQLNRMTSMIDASNSRTWSFGYDANGNLLTNTVPGLGSTSYQYDELGRMTKVSYPDSSIVQYEYDLNGNRTRMIDSSGITSYSYDEANRLTSVTDPFGKVVGYSYDGVGNVKRIIYPGNKNLDYAYDAGERLMTVTNWIPRTTTYEYNKIDQLTQIINGNSTKTSLGYDNANRLTSLQNLKGNGAGISSHAYTLDANGNVQTAAIVLPLQPQFASSNTNLVFDAANRIITSGSTNFTHDLAGRIVAETTGATSKNYAYNFRDLLTAISGSSDTYSYIYNGDGNRLAMSKNSVQIRYVLDQNAELPDVLAETDAAGEVKSYYTYGNGLISKIDAVSGQESWYHFDPTGNTLALTDAGQNVTDSYAYTPYGEATVQGTSSNPFRYSGKHGVLDDGNGLNYMRARYYKPEIARFMSLDTVLGDVEQAQSLNRYAYVQGNPLLMVDPSGNQQDMCYVDNRKNSTIKKQEKSNSYKSEYLSLLSDITSDIDKGLKYASKNMGRFRGFFDKYKFKIIDNSKVRKKIGKLLKFMKNNGKSASKYMGKVVMILTPFFEEYVPMDIMQSKMKGLDWDQLPSDMKTMAIIGTTAESVTFGFARAGAKTPSIIKIVPYHELVISDENIDWWDKKVDENINADSFGELLVGLLYGN